MTPGEMSELAVLGKTLNSESNDLNQTIESFNENLAALKLGIEVWHPSEDPEIQIGFAKVVAGGNPVWQLATREKFYDRTWNGHEWEGEEWKEGDWSPPESLLGASRDSRIEGLELMPRILSDLKRTAQEKIQVIQEAKQLAAELSKDRKILTAK